MNIVVTGCSSGIGKYCVQALLEAGHHVYATVRDQASFAQLQQQGAIPVMMELSDNQSIDAACDYILQHSQQRIDALFNNAAYGQTGAIEDLSSEALAQQLQVNVIGWHRFTRAFIPIFIAQGHGRIVQCSSVLGLVGLRFRGAYVASKFALEGLSDCLRLELADTGVQVSLIEPGPIESQFRANAKRMFETHINVAQSRHKDAYVQQLERLKSDKSKQPGVLGPEAVYKALNHALTAKHAKARYYVTWPTYLLAWVRRFMPVTISDRFFRALG